MNKNKLNRSSYFAAVPAATAAALPTADRQLHRPEVRVRQWWRWRRTWRPDGNHHGRRCPVLRCRRGRRGDANANGLRKKKLIFSYFPTQCDFLREQIYYLKKSVN